MVDKRRIRTLKARTEGRRAQRELKDVFLTNMARIRAFAQGEDPPPEHPTTSRHDPQTFFGSCSLKDEPEDLSE